MQVNEIRHRLIQTTNTGITEVDQKNDKVKEVAQTINAMTYWNTVKEDLHVGLAWGTIVGAHFLPCYVAPVLGIKAYLNDTSFEETANEAMTSLSNASSLFNSLTSAEITFTALGALVGGSIGLAKGHWRYISAQSIR